MLRALNDSIYYQSFCLSSFRSRHERNGFMISKQSYCANSNARTPNNNDGSKRHLKLNDINSKKSRLVISKLICEDNDIIIRTVPCQLYFT